MLSEMCEVLSKSPSYGLRKWRQYQIGAQIIQASLGVVYSVAAAISDSEVMDPDVYGEYVTSVKAEVWSYPTMIIPIIFLFGIVINGNWRWSPVVRLISAIGNAMLAFAFSYLAYSPGPISPFVVLCGLWVAIHVWFMYINLGDTVRAVRYDRVTYKH